MIRCLVLCLLCVLPLQAHAQERSSADLTVRPDLAFADARDPPPRSGTALRIMGFISLGIAAAALAQVPLCRFNTYDEAGGQRRCRVTGAVLLSVALPLSLPLLLFGYRRGAAHQRWLERHGLRVAGP